MLDINNILKQFHDFTIKNSNQLILFINNKENAKIVPKKKYQNLNYSILSFKNKN